MSACMRLGGVCLHSWSVVRAIVRDAFTPLRAWRQSCFSFRLVGGAFFPPWSGEATGSRHSLMSVVGLLLGRCQCSLPCGRQRCLTWLLASPSACIDPSCVLGGACFVSLVGLRSQPLCQSLAHGTVCPIVGGCMLLICVMACGLEMVWVDLCV